jgi:peptide chain release factor 1
MSAVSPDKLERILERFAAIEHGLSAGATGDAFVKLSKDYAEMEPTARTAKALKLAYKGLDELSELIAQGGELAEMAQEEKPALETRIAEFEKQIRIQLLPKDAADERNVILEVRAGTGGDEAAIFAGDLFRMYQRYAASKNWRVEVISASDGEHGGYKEVIANIYGAGAFAHMKFESGVHRVQRVPDTETQGRIHTSAATVAVLPEAEEVDIKIEDKDLRIDVYRSSGPGGQSVNTTDSAVRVTHIPTGISVAQQTEKSQLKNKNAAMKLLRARLYEIERNRIDSERSATRKGQVGSGDRSERIRTYNFPQGRLTDHRINLTIYNLPEIMQGAALEEVVQSLVTDHQATLMAEQDANG